MQLYGLTKAMFRSKVYKKTGKEGYQMLTVVAKKQAGWDAISEGETTFKDLPIETPVLLTPARIESMIKARSSYQVIKFRTTCTDCVPNL